jgi:hypothetical protein
MFVVRHVVRLFSFRRMKWKKDHKLPNTKSKLPDQLPAASTSSNSSSPRTLKKEDEDEDQDEEEEEEEEDQEEDFRSIPMGNFIKEESFSPADSSN